MQKSLRARLLHLISEAMVRYCRYVYRLYESVWRSDRCPGRDDVDSIARLYATLTVMPDACRLRTSCAVG
jgi:hypothetical protein